MKSPTLCRPIVFLALTMSLAAAVYRPLLRTPISNRCPLPAVQHVIEFARLVRLGFLAFVAELSDTSRWTHDEMETKMDLKKETDSKKEKINTHTYKCIYTSGHRCQEIEVRPDGTISQNYYFHYEQIESNMVVNGLWVSQCSNLPTTSKFILLFLVGELLKSTRHRNIPASWSYWNSVEWKTVKLDELGGGRGERKISILVQTKSTAIAIANKCRTHTIMS